jgi:hypothetical protein
MTSPSRHIVYVARLIFANGLAFCALFAFAQQTQSASSSQPLPVLVELFTSEGCSDCPPADAALSVLDAKQPVPGANIIVLSEHVTYWNHQGWEDPFSFSDIDDRQNQYVRQFSLPSPATPQFVIDGAAQIAGYDPAKLAQDITHAATVPKIDLQLADVRRAPDGSINFTVKAAPGPKATLVAAVAENATQSKVTGGENAGHTLQYVAVVRVLKEFGSNSADGRPLKLSGGDLSRAEKDGEPLRLVAFLVNHKNGQVIGVAQQTVNP